MNQVKYSVYACLILLLLFVGAYSLNKLSSTQIITEKKSEIDFGQANEPIEENSTGAKIFRQNCATCHSINKELSTGPALAGIEERGPWSDRKNLLKWVNNPAAFMATNEYTQALKMKYGTMMTGFPQLTVKDINEIFDYIKKTAAPQIVAEK